MLDQAGFHQPELAVAQAVRPAPGEAAGHVHDAQCAGQPHYDQIAPFPMWSQDAPPPPGRAYRLAMALWTKPSWLAPLAVLACLGAAFTYVLSNNPSDTAADPLGPCAFKLVTGLDCPGCGGTRMVWFLLHGDVVHAARYHIIALIAVPVVIWAYVVWSAKRIFGVKIPSIRIPPLAIGIYLGVWMLFSVVRDLPWAPFNLLFVS
jgi:hypothetical protein